MLRPGARDGRGAEVDPDATRRPQRRQELAGAAAEIEHAEPLGDEKPPVAVVFGVIRGVALDPTFALGREAFALSADPLLPRRKRLRANRFFGDVHRDGHSPPFRYASRA